MVTAAGRPTPIATLPKTSLREQVGRALRSAVVSGELEPGVVYSAPALAARFGVSATPVREAMIDLVRENLFAILPNKGFRVTAVDDATLDEITDLRLLIEPVVVARVTPEIPESDLPALRALAQAIVAAAEHDDLVAYTEADQEFHLALLAYAGNRRIVDLVAQLRGQTRLLGLTALRDRGELVAAAAEHLTIVDLVAARDGAAVQAFLRRHIGQVRTVWAGPRAGSDPGATPAEDARDDPGQEQDHGDHEGPPGQLGDEPDTAQDQRQDDENDCQNHGSSLLEPTVTSPSDHP